LLKSTVKPVPRHGLGFLQNNLATIGNVKGWWGCGKKGVRGHTRFYSRWNGGSREYAGLVWKVPEKVKQDRDAGSHIIQGHPGH